MKIAFVSQPFDKVPSEGASIAIWNQELTRSLGDSYHTSIYCRKQTDDTENEVNILRISTTLDEKIIYWIRRCQAAVHKLLRRDTDLFHNYYFSTFYYIFYIIGVARRMRAEQPDIIVISNFSQFVPIVRFFNPRAKILLMMHCDWLIELGWNSINRRLSKVDAVCGCSNYIVQGIKRRFPRHESKCFTLHNGSNLDIFCEEEDEKNITSRLRKDLGLENKTVVLFAGRVCPEKGVHILIDAMKDVLASNSDVTLVIVGGISLQPPSPLWIRNRDKKVGEFERLKADYKNILHSLARPIASDVHFVGRIDHQGLADYYTLGDIFVHPAVWNEPFGMTITEAMSCGRPVISTKAGGIPEIVVQGETGLLVPPNDASELARAILAMMADPDKRRNMGYRGKERVQTKFTWDNTAAKFKEILRIMTRAEY